MTFLHSRGFSTAVKAGQYKIYVPHSNAGLASVAYCVHAASDRKRGIGSGRRLVLLKLGVSSELLLSVSYLLPFTTLSV